MTGCVYTTPAHNKSLILPSYSVYFIVIHLLIDIKLFKNQQAADFLFFPLQFKMYKWDAPIGIRLVQPLAYLSLRHSGSDISDCLPKPQVELRCDPGARYSSPAGAPVKHRLCKLGEQNMYDG